MVICHHFSTIFFQNNDLKLNMVTEVQVLLKEVKYMALKF